MALLAAVTLVAGCTSGASGGVTAPPADGSISVVLTPASVSLTPGSQGGLGIAVTRGGSFAGPVTLTATGVPAGVTVQFGSAVVASGAFSTSATVTVATGTAVQSTAVAITGTGGGLTSPVATLTIRVQ